MIKEGLGDDQREALAEELGQEMRKAADVWRDHGVMTKTMAAAILADPKMQEMIRRARARWNHIDNTEERIKQRSRTSVEAAILPTYQAAVSDGQPLSARVKALEFMARMGGLEKKSEPGLLGGGGNTVSIKIDLTTGEGDDRVIVIEGQRDADDLPDGPGDQTSAASRVNTARVDLTAVRDSRGQTASGGGVGLFGADDSDEDFDDAGVV